MGECQGGASVGLLHGRCWGICNGQNFPTGDWHPHDPTGGHNGQSPKSASPVRFLCQYVGRSGLEMGQIAK